MNILSKFMFLVAISVCFSMRGQTLINEDFESATSIPPTGWSVINDTQDGTNYHWDIDTYSPLAGKKSAVVQCGGYTYNEPAKEEWLVTPTLDLSNDSYKLSFLWEGATAASITKKEYDFQVRVQVVGEDSWTTIWSILDKDAIVNSGLSWPWTAWAKNESSLDLTQFKGKKVKIAFVHCKLIAGKGKGNNIWLDDISVEKYTPILTPQIETSESSYSFPSIYIGSKKYSKAITMTNIGQGTLTLESVSGLEGTNFGTTIDPSKVSLAKGESYSFAVTYEPTKTGAATATLVLTANGGNPVSIKLSGSKKALPTGYNYEGFEGNVFPPLGWALNGTGWNTINYALSGDKSAYCSLTSESSLVSPRLDLSEDKEHVVIFDYFDQWEASSDDATEPDSYYSIYLSTDGGATWGEPLFVNNIYNEQCHKEISLGNPKSDNCYIKWEYSIPGFDMSSFDDVPEYSLVYLDDVVLPPFYGANDKPVKAELVSPSDKAEDQMAKNLKLVWKGVQFATGYKVYAGTSTGATDIVNGEDVGLVTEYTLPKLKYSTKYYWKVVPYNAAGAGENATEYSFTTMADQSVTEYPYFEGFEKSTEMPLAWLAEKEGYTHWSISNYGSYDGKRSAFAGGNSNNTTATLTTQDFVLPNEETIISFYWGNSAPASLIKDALGTNPNTTTQADDVDAAYFEIESDGVWKQLAILSEYGDDLYWHRENISLDAYKGKTVAFRWRYNVVNGMKSHGVTLDNITIDKTAGKCNAYFNANNWNAGEVNYNKSTNSKEVLSIANGGSTNITIKDVKFSSSKFSSNLAAETTMAPNEVKQFNVTYSAGDTPGTTEDNMVVEFTDGTSLSLPVAGTALASDVLFFNFEDDEFGSTQPQGFTTVDVDMLSTVRPVFINYPKYGSPFAFYVLNVTANCADWRNVYPRSGDQVLYSACDGGRSGSTNDWIISGKLTATSQSQFRFYGKSYGSAEDFDLHKVNVLVSTTDNSIGSFEAVQSNIELPYSAKQEFTEFKIDLSKYAGKNIYIALQHIATPDGFVAFFDDFYFEHFSNASGVDRKLSDAISVYPNPVVDELHIDGMGNVDVTLFSMSGAVIKRADDVQKLDMQDVQPGVYTLQITSANNTFVIKVVKK